MENPLTSAKALVLSWVMGTIGWLDDLESPAINAAYDEARALARRLAKNADLPLASRLKLQALAAEHRGQTGAGGLIRLVIGIAVAVIVAVGVAIPIVNDVIAQSNLTGLTALIVGFIPVMLGVLIFVATVGPIMSRAG